MSKITEVRRYEKRQKDKKEIKGREKLPCLLSSLVS